MNRRATSVGKTRSCPHCRATILESSAICPACKHHLRFERRSGTEPEPVGEVALKVSGIFSRKTKEGPGEYSVVVVIRDAKGTEIARKVIGVGALSPGEERSVDLTVETFNP